jgi:monoamine oxidase
MGPDCKTFPCRPGGARYTRREFLGQLTFATVAGSSWITPVAARGLAPKRVIVVGAGLAGLCAAYELGALGHDVTVLEAQTRPGGRVQTLRDPFDDGLFAEAGASRIPTSHDLTLGYARMFGLTLVPFEPVSVPSIRYAYGQRSRILPDAPFEWPSGISANQKRLSPADVRRRYIEGLVDQITDPFSAAWMPESLRQYDRVTRDEYLRAQGVSEAALHMMNLGYTPVARYRSFLDVLHENAVARELRRRASIDNDLFLKIDGGNDRLPRAFADRLAGRIRYGCSVHRIEHDVQGVRVSVRTGQSVESSEAGYVVCAVPFSTLRSVAFSPALTSEKRSVIDALPYESVTRIYLQSRDRYWMHERLSGFGETDHPMEIWDSTYGQPGTRGILMSYIRGPKARELGRQSQAAQLGFGLKTIEDVYPGIRKNYERGYVKVWDRDPWSRGAVAYLLPGQVSSLQPHIAQPEGRIHFAGEHASSVRGWMQGALESGRRVASEIDAA